MEDEPRLHNLKICVRRSGLAALLGRGCLVFQMDSVGEALSEADVALIRVTASIHDLLLTVEADEPCRFHALVAGPWATCKTALQDILHVLNQHGYDFETDTSKWGRPSAA